MEAFIIPAKYYRGFFNRLREKDFERWEALVNKERELYNKKHSLCSETT
jgi:hypothetical protein